MTTKPSLDDNLTRLWRLLEDAERNVIRAKASTGILEHRGRIMDAEEIRNQAQHQYNVALRGLINQATQK